jgi:hypothetical protein
MDPAWTCRRRRVRTIGHPPYSAELGRSREPGHSSRSTETLSTSSVERVVGFRQRVELMSKAANRPLSRRSTAGAPQSDDCRRQLQDHDDAEGNHATRLEEGEDRGSPRRRGRGNADPGQGSDETERHDQAPRRRARVEEVPGARVRRARRGRGTVDAPSVCSTGPRGRRQEGVAHRLGLYAWRQAWRYALVIGRT